MSFVVVVLAGCAPFATYPPVEGSIAINNPTFEPVPSIMADAIRAVHERYGEGHDDYAINLPEGAPEKAYRYVLHKLGEAKPQESADEWAYHLTAIRSRGLNAEADVIVPRDGAPPVMVTLRMRKHLTNYAIESVKQWNYPVELPPPHFMPGADEAIASETGEN